MSRIRSFLLLLLVTIMSPSLAEEVALSAGMEYFTWEEFAPQIVNQVKETGPRFFLALEGEAEIDQNWNSHFLGKLYTGQIDYDGELLPGHEPHQTDTDYNGWNIEIDFLRSLTTDTSREMYGGWWLRLSLGYENWTRDILGNWNSDINAYVRGYEEEYSVFYSRLGALYERDDWQLQAGLKYPLRVSEKVNYFYINLSPDEAVSFYAKATYKLATNWSVLAYYDSYRFDKSDIKNGFFQPESHMDTYGVQGSYYFK